MPPDDLLLVLMRRDQVKDLTKIVHNVYVAVKVHGPVVKLNVFFTKESAADWLHDQFMIYPSTEPISVDEPEEEPYSELDFMTMDQLMDPEGEAIVALMKHNKHHYMGTGIYEIPIRLRGALTAGIVPAAW